MIINNKKIIDSLHGFKFYKYCIICGILSLGFIHTSDAQNNNEQENSVQQNTQTPYSIISKINAIKLQPLSILPKVDCDLDDLEREYYTTQTHIAPSIDIALKSKREQIDYMRSYIDSLYYVQAIELLIKDSNNWGAANKYIDIALMHNSLNKDAILLKLAYLDRENKTHELLKYSSSLIDKYVSNAEVIKALNKIYQNSLNDIETLIDNGLFNDALTLLNKCTKYFFSNKATHTKNNIERVLYRENNIKYLAHQGIFNSFYSVAETALNQDLYLMANNYTTTAYNYYVNNVKYMSGVNPSLSLFDKLIKKYTSFLQYSDQEDRAFYKTNIENIQKLTSENFASYNDFDLNKEIISKLNYYNSSAKERISTNKIEKRDEVIINQDLIKTISSQDKLSNAKANVYFNKLYENTKIAYSERKFYTAYSLIQKADTLILNYEIKVDEDFNKFSTESAIKAIEQMLNKALYRLWNNDFANADSAYYKAMNISYKYNTEENLQIQNLISNYKFQKQNVLKVKVESQVNNFLLKADQMLRHNDFTDFKYYLNRAKTILNNFENEVKSNLKIDTNIFNALKEVKQEYIYFDSIFNELETTLAKGLSIEYINNYLDFHDLFMKSKLHSYSPASYNTLFKTLSTKNDYNTIFTWAKMEMEKEDWDMAHFLISYLIEVECDVPDLEKTHKTLRKIIER